jgi:hypothetical protein
MCSAFDERLCCHTHVLITHAQRTTYNFYVARTFYLTAKICALNFHIQHTNENIY